MGQRIVKNYPSPRLMETIGATNQKPAEAIGELVANSFDARIDEERVEITVDLRNSKIKVLDNGKGMTINILEKAVCIAEDMSKHLERNTASKGHFGMGFKTSCSTLGKYYEIYTRPLNDKTEFHVGFDINDYKNRPSGADSWDVIIDEKEYFADSPLGVADHGTAFVISKIKVDLINTSSILSYLGEAFKGHIETGDKITVIGEDGRKHVAIPPQYNFIKGSKIEIDELCAEKYRVKGWVALDSQTHNDTNYGFNIFRNNQLVEKWDRTWFKSHLMTSRIIGEVSMDFLDATFYKQGVQQIESWKIVAIHMTEFLKPVVSASRNISKRGNINNPNELKKIITNLNNSYGLEIDDDVFNNENSVSESKNSDENKKNEASINENIRTIVKEQELVLENQDVIEITYLESNSSGDLKVPFDYIFSEPIDDDENSELQVIMFKSHPLWQRKIDNEVIKLLATYDAIYRVLVEKLNFETSEALKIRNEWLSNRTHAKEEK